MRTARHAAALGLLVAGLTSCGGPHRGVQVSPAGPGVAAQVAPVAIGLRPADRHRYESFDKVAAGGPPVILVYHDVQPHPVPPYTVSPSQLASHLAMLRAAGFTPVTARQVVAWLGGGHIPAKAVLLTFDDSTKGTWVYADPILAAAGSPAVSFVITGWVGTHQPYYLTWAELRRMQASGRWSLESHSRLSHQRLPIDVTGTTAPALINRLWLADQGRLETLDEFTARVRADLAASKADLVAHGLPEPSLFAYPFSAVSVPTDDPAAPARTSALVRELFAAGLVDSDGAGAMTPEEVRARLLHRVDVGTATTAAQLFDLVTRSTAVPLGNSALLFSVPTGWTDHGGGPLPPGALDGGRMRLDPDSGGWKGADFDAARTGFWSGYRATVRVGGLGVPGHGGFGGLRVLVGDPSQLQVAVSGDWVSVRMGLGADEASVLEQALTVAETHTVAVSLSPGRADVIVDGHVVIRVSIPTGAAGGVGVMARREDATSPMAVLTDLRVDAGPVGSAS